MTVFISSEQRPYRAPTRNLRTRATSKLAAMTSQVPSGTITYTKAAFGFNRLISVPFCHFCSLFKSSDSYFNVLNFDRLLRMIKNAIRSPHAH